MSQHTNQQGSEKPMHIHNDGMPQHHHSMSYHDSSAPGSPREHNSFKGTNDVPHAQKDGSAARTIKKTGTFHGKPNNLGGGGRFAQVEEAARKSGASNPAAVAAAAGRKSLGKAKFQKLAAAGRRRAA